MASLYMRESEMKPTPKPGELIRFRVSESTGETELGYVERVFRSGSLTVHMLHPGGRGRKTHVEPHQYLETLKGIKRHDQDRLI